MGAKSQPTMDVQLVLGWITERAMMIVPHAILDMG
jgi:hypothetical protein